MRKYIYQVHIISKPITKKGVKGYSKVLQVRAYDNSSICCSGGVWPGVGLYFIIPISIGLLVLQSPLHAFFFNMHPDLLEFNILTSKILLLHPGQCKDLRTL